MLIQPVFTNRLIRDYPVRVLGLPWCRHTALEMAVHVTAWRASVSGMRCAKRMLGLRMRYGLRWGLSTSVVRPGCVHILMVRAPAWVKRRLRVGCTCDVIKGGWLFQQCAKAAVANS